MIEAYDSKWAMADQPPQSPIRERRDGTRNSRSKFKRDRRWEFEIERDNESLGERKREDETYEN